jgi:two-component system, NarL family, invasion response regulator UvrY
MDINMPEMDGYETTLWLKNNHPDIKVLALSMYDNENAIIRMLRAGVKGYILKDCDPSELKYAINSIITSGFYYTENVTGKLISIVSKKDNDDELNEREIAFLKLVCSELTYKEIADKMYKGVRTIDGYRDALFEKLNVKTRVGLVLYAIKNGIVSL